MIHDDSGADFLIAKMGAALVVAAVLIVMLLSGISDLSGTFSTIKARGEAQKISEFSRLAYYTEVVDSMTDRSLTVSIPSSVRLLAFGAISANGTLARMDRSYYIEFTDGRIESYVSDVPFTCDGTEGPSDLPVLLYPGHYCLKARPVSLNGSIMAGISAEAA